MALVAAFWMPLDCEWRATSSPDRRPLEQVVAASERLGEEGGVQLPVPPDRELAELVMAVNRMSLRLEERRQENERLIASLEERVEQKTREVLRADRLATLGGIAAGFAHELGNSLNGPTPAGSTPWPCASCPTTTPTGPTSRRRSGRWREQRP